MFNRLTAIVDNARRCLSGNTTRSVHDDENVLSHATATPTTGEDEVDGDEIDQDDDDEVFSLNAVINYDSAKGDVEGESDANQDDGRPSIDHRTGQRLASLEDLLGPGELARCLAEQRDGSDGSMTEIEDNPDADVHDAEERMRRVAEDAAWAAMSDEDRAACQRGWQDIQRIVAEDRRIADEKARMQQEMECGPDCAHCAECDADSDLESTSEYSDSAGVSTSSTEPDDGHAAARTTPPPPFAVAETPEEAPRRSPTPEIHAAPLTDAKHIVPAAPLLKSLVGASRTSILTALLGRGHYKRIPVSRYGPLSPVPSRDTSPATDTDIEDEEDGDAPTIPITITPQMAAGLVAASGASNALRRFHNGDRFIPDGNGGFYSARTQRHVTRLFEPTYEENNFLKELRDLKAKRLAREERKRRREASQQQLAPSASDKLQDVDMADYEHAATDNAGDCSPSPDEGTSSQHWQPVQEPATPLSTQRTQKRARSEDDDDAEAQSEKRRRVATEEQPGSPRPGAGRRNRNQIGASSPTAATRSTPQISTAACTAPEPLYEGPAVAVHIQHAANGSDETPMASTFAVPVAGPSRATAATPTRKPRAPARTAPSEGSRRSPRIGKVEDARAAAAAAVAAEASLHKTQRGSRAGKGKAKVKGLA